MNPATTLAIDVLVIEDASIKPLRHLSFKKKCCDKVAKGKQCKRCPLLDIV